MKRTIIFVMLAILVLPALAVSGVATPEASIDPEQINFILKVIIGIAQTQPWGIWVGLGFAVLGGLAGVTRLVIVKTPSTKDDKWLEEHSWIFKILGNLPTLTTAKTANKVVGKGKADPGMLKEAIRKAKKLFIPLLVISLVLPGCVKRLNVHDQTNMDELRAVVDTAQTVTENVQTSLPVLEESVDALCETGDAPGWCEDIPTIKADIRDSLASLNILLEQVQSALDAGKVKKPEVLTQKVVTGLAELVGAYMRVQAIINRH